jgi:hypothetical protein
MNVFPLLSGRVARHLADMHQSHFSPLHAELAARLVTQLAFLQGALFSTLGETDGAAPFLFVGNGGPTH